MGKQIKYNNTSDLTGCKGFTLAEVLIALAIIGVVAALTIPGLLLSIQKQQYVSSFKKTYSILSQGALLLADENGGSLAGKYSSDLAFVNALGKYISFIKVCNAGASPGACWHNGVTTWHTLHGDNGWGDPTTYTRAIGVDGVLYRAGLTFLNCNDSTYVQNGVNLSCGNILVDVNGFKGPNIMGRDLFMFHLTKNGKVVPSGAEGIVYQNLCDPSVYNAMQGLTCSSKVMETGDINY